MRKIVHYINILFNLSSHEWPRVILSWLLKFILQASYIMGSTVLLALFVEEYGVTNLPFLYITSSLFIVFGSILFSFFLERFTKKNEIFMITIFSSILFLIVPFFSHTSSVFYGTLFFTLSVFLAQLNIILYLFIEELFSPLESERTLPIIESAEPIGGIFAGLLLTASVTVFNLSAVTILYYVGIILFFIVPILLSFLKFTNKVPRLEIKEEIESSPENRFARAQKGLRHIKGVTFLKGMLVVVLLHFAFLNLVEFQYTTALDASIKNEKSIHPEESTHHVADEDNSYVNALTHGLAFWHVTFSIIAFLIQVLSASRIHKRLGVIKSMKIHPLLNLFSGVFLLFKFGYVSGVAARGIFEVTTLMHRTSYHASFYALKKSIRDQVKEFMEGIIRPFGMMLGTILLLVIVYFSPKEIQHNIISGCMVIIMIVMYVSLSKMKSQYTLVAKKNLTARNSNIEKIEAIEILSQKGHEDVLDILGKNVHDHQHPIVQSKILETLGAKQDVNSIPSILNAFDSEFKEVKLAAARSLGCFKELGKHFFSQSFAKHRVIQALHKLFLETKSKTVKSAIIRVFKNINNADVIPFILKVLDNKDENVIADAIYVCGLFNDINAAYYIEKYLKSENPIIRSTTIVSLWNFPVYRLKCLIQLTSMLESNNEKDKISGIYVLGEIRSIQEIPRLIKFLEHENEIIQCHAAIALAKMENVEVTEKVVEFLLHEEEKIKRLTSELLQKVSLPIKRNISNAFKHEISAKIHEIIKKANSSLIDDISEDDLRKLQGHYALISETKEVLMIEEELERRGK